MDHDSFLEVISERSKLRSDFLNRKMNDSAKKRSVFFEDTQNSGHDDTKLSPKRQCLESDKIQFNEASLDKENCMDSEDNFDDHYSPVKGLAVLRKRKIVEEDDNNDTEGLDENEREEVNAQSNSRTHKSRLAALADQVNQWEDDSWNTSFERHFSKTNANNASTKTSSFTIASNTANSENKGSKCVSFHPSCENESPVENRELSSIGVPFSEPSVHLNKIKINQEITNRSPQKVANKIKVWDQAILTTLESQGFVKSPSTAKLSYEFKKESKLVDFKNKSGVFSNKAENISVTPSSSKFQVIAASSAQDPAELPLAARKALFEQVFCNSALKQQGSDKPSNLTVAQRAAMFENASSNNKFPTSPFSSPKKFTSNTSMPTSPAKQFNQTVQSPLKNQKVETVLSPSKNASLHTRVVQQKLIESSASDWRNNEIARKTSNERSQEISALMHHWEKVSSSSADKLDTEDESERSFEETCSNDETDETTDYDGDQSESSVPEDLPSVMLREKPIMGSSSTQRESENSISSNFTDEAIATCNTIDDILDDDVIENQISMPPPMPVLHTLSNVARVGSMCANSPVSSPAKQSKMEVISAKKGGPRTPVNEDIPLMHTVSFYRRQKQEKRPTPVKTIVRRENITSPPLPEVDTTHIIQEKIKALQDEILAQQTVISQTSQALNLCHATEEFFGSTEQVEAERLLLIATQKRQAFLNEIQRLKTHGAHGTSELDGTGTLVLNNIQLPLKQDFLASQLDTKNNNTVHYFLCLVRHGHQVIVTQMLSTLDNITNGSLCFTNHITLHDMPPDFSVAFEVYALQTKKEVLTHDRKYHIKKDHGKLKLTPKGKKSESRLIMPSVSSPGGPNAVRTPCFAVVGFTRFHMKNCHRETTTLEKVPFASPLEGVLKLKMHLHSEHNVTEKGFLTMFDDVSGYGAWHRRWGVLNGETLIFWKYPDDEGRKEPILALNLKQCITGEVKQVSRDVCARAYTFELVTVRPQAKDDKNTLISRSVNTLTTTKFLLSADTKEERILWCKRLNEALTNVRKWDSQALRPISAGKPNN